MAYLDTRPMTPARLWSIGIVMVLHTVLLYALVTGTYREVIKTVTRFTTTNVPAALPEPVEPVPVPLPKQNAVEPPVMTPKPRVETAASTPVELITTPDAPVVYNPGPIAPVIAPVTPTPVATVPPAAGIATRAALRGGSISDDDYPPAAIRAEEQGRSTATYTVGTAGRVTACSAVGAGPILDAETCKLIERRFRFAPAKDAGGSSIAETKTQSITWRLPR